MLLLGDLLLGGEFSEVRERRGWPWSHPFERILPELTHADVVFANLEGPLGNAGEPRDKWVRLYSPEDSIIGLKRAGVNVVSLANNHITDHGCESVRRTMQLLDNHNVQWFGVGINSGEVRKSIVIVKSGVRICFLGYADPSEMAVTAGPMNAGCLPVDPNRILEDIRSIRECVDVLCVSLHWGKEFYRYPSPSQISIARQLVDHGADIIIGHHAHVYQGVERYRGGLICYNLGNFFMPSFRAVSGKIFHFPKACNELLMVKVQLQEGRVLRYEPLFTSLTGDYQIVLKHGARRRHAQIEFERLGTATQKDNYQTFYRCYDVYKKLGFFLERRKRTLREQGVIGTFRLMMSFERWRRFACRFQRQDG